MVTPARIVQRTAVPLIQVVVVGLDTDHEPAVASTFSTEVAVGCATAEPYGAVTELFDLYCQFSAEPHPGPEDAELAIWLAMSRLLPIRLGAGCRSVQFPSDNRVRGQYSSCRS
ncbi:hypothetical protein ACWCQS_43460 [Streptomyces sp. NPDC002076]